MMVSDIYSTFTLHNIDIYSRHPPGNSESPSPCRWECLWRTGACCWGCPCLENKENVLEERHFCECECHPICRSSVCLDKGIIAFMTFGGIGMGMRITQVTNKNIYPAAGQMCCKRPWRSEPRPRDSCPQCWPCPGQTQSSGSWWG